MRLKNDLEGGPSSVMRENENFGFLRFADGDPEER
jgi:hypothetical protein